MGRNGLIIKWRRFRRKTRRCAGLIDYRMVISDSRHYRPLSKCGFDLSLSVGLDRYYTDLSITSLRI